VKKISGYLEIRFFSMDKRGLALGGVIAEAFEALNRYLYL